MKIREVLLNRETTFPVLALSFASAVSVALVVARVAWTGNIRYVFLVWNVFLAWLPLIFALLATEHFKNGLGRNWRFFSLAGAWLLFFPNAPYIFTDLVHVTTRYYGSHFWVDMVLILLCALTGLVLGFVSLYLMQSVVSQIVGRVASWIFIAAVAGLSSFGVYLGRFLRFNSWDVFIQPVNLTRGIGHWAMDPLAHPHAVAFPVLFATFLFVTYLMLYALTHLPKANSPTPA